MPSLYSFDKTYEELFEKMESLALDGEEVNLTELENDLNLNEDQRTEKLVNYVKKIRVWESEILLAKEEKARIDKLMKAKESSINRLKDNIKNSMIARGEKDIDLKTFKLGLRSSSSVNTDKLTELVETLVIPKTELTFSDNTGDKLDSLQDLVKKGVISYKTDVIVSKTNLKPFLKDDTEILGSKLEKNQSVTIK